MIPHDPFRLVRGRIDERSRTSKRTVLVELAETNTWTEQFTTSFEIRGRKGASSMI